VSPVDSPAPDPVSGRPLRAVTLDFGNTLVPVDRQGLQAVVATAAAQIAARSRLPDEAAFIRAWAEERDRQFRDEVPHLREVDLSERVTRVFARLRGMDVPSPEERWDDAAAARLSQPEEVAAAVEIYGDAFVEGMPAAPEVEPVLRRLRGRGLRLAILSNWPLAATIDRYAERAGWTTHLAAIVVSQRVGVVKPHPGIFTAAHAALGGPPVDTILHVGDDWAADVVGANSAGWRTAYVRSRPVDTPLPTSRRDASIVPDVEVTSIADLEAGIDRLGLPPTGSATA